MHHFEYRDGELFAEGVSARELADQYGTPLYVYSHATLERHIRVLQEAFADLPHLIAYSVKSNPSLAVLRIMQRAGAGADIVSSGELERALRCQVAPEHIVFSGVGKRPDEISAAVDTGILCFNVEVEGELETISKIACEKGKTAGVSIRVNPDVDPETHDYIATGTKVTKFGIPFEDAEALYDKAMLMPGVQVVGVDCHIGSQVTTIEPFTAMLRRIRQLVETLSGKGIQISHIDVGGGLGVRYKDETPPTPAEYAAAIATEIGDLGVTIVLEPGRVLVANAGILLTRVLYRKQTQGKNFVIVDGAMNDLLRPALYGAYHEIDPVKESTARITADVVGPVCESGDFFAREQDVPDAQPGELLALMGCGAYGRTMSSNYNSRLRAAEVLVKDEEAFVIQERESVTDMLVREFIPDFLFDS